MKRVFLLACVLFSQAGCPCFLLLCDPMPTLPPRTAFLLSYSPQPRGPPAFTASIVQTGRFLVDQGSSTFEGSLSISELNAILAECRRLGFYGFAPSYVKAASAGSTISLSVQHDTLTRTVTVTDPNSALQEPEIQATVYLWSRLVTLLRERGCDSCGRALNTIPYVERPRAAA